MFKSLIATLLMLSTVSGFAQTSLGGINQEDLNVLGREFAANFAHSSVMPPVSLGDVFGLELGVSLGATSTPGFDRLAKEQNPNTTISAIPHAGAVLAFSVPKGFTGEIVILPDFGSKDLTIGNTSFAVRWAIGKELLGYKDFLLDARLHHSSSTLAFNQTEGANTIKVAFDTSTTGLQLVAGYDFFVLQPYFGMGFITGGTDVSAQGSTTFFDNTFTTGTSASSSESSFQWLAGLQIDLLFLHLGFEYQNFFETSKYTGKLSLAF